MTKRLTDGRPNGWTESAAMGFMADHHYDLDIGGFARLFNQGCWPEIQKHWPEFQVWLDKNTLNPSLGLSGQKL